MTETIRFFDESMSLEECVVLPATTQALGDHIRSVLKAKGKHTDLALNSILSQPMEISHHCYDGKLDGDLYVVIVKSYGQVGFIDRIPNPTPTLGVAGNQKIVSVKGNVYTHEIPKKDIANARATEVFIDNHYVVSAPFIKAELEKVFGQGLIKECYHYEYGGDLTEKVKQERLSTSKDRWKNTVIKDSRTSLPVLQWDTTEFIVVFNNGASVRFSNSEWAAFAKLHTPTLEARVK